MKPTEQELQSMAENAGAVFGIEQVWFVKGFENAISQMQPEWVEIDQYPQNHNPVVIRWHKVWKCPVSVQHRRAYAEDGCEWLSGTKDNTWPEEAFEPFFQYLPQPPTK